MALYSGPFTRASTEEILASEQGRGWNINGRLPSGNMKNRGTAAPTTQTTKPSEDQDGEVLAEQSTEEEVETRGGGQTREAEAVTLCCLAEPSESDLTQIQQP
ncbi:hypothetical protein DY000_02062881 [Brassica cretica]|uniref:Uncharacterized protein n=1 Tax=Brassica cretica TaxID=69181 RepID=A0ABQ7AQ46_BRACR|nr:hypothetical protein DY000_02062881 [Brassica cretica]